MKSTLGYRLKEAREKKRFTQLEVAQKLGISNGTLSGYERNYRDPDTETLKRLANLYEVTVDYLLEGTSRTGTKEKAPKELSAAATEAVISDLVKKYNIDLSDPSHKQRLEDIIRLIYAHDQKSK